MASSVVRGKCLIWNQLTAHRAVGPRGYARSSGICQ